MATARTSLPEVAFVESNGWDTHSGQGSTGGRLARGLGELGSGLAALFTDLGDRMDDVVIVTMSMPTMTILQLWTSDWRICLGVG